jgi:hypothetical protein
MCGNDLFIILYFHQKGKFFPKFLFNFPSLILAAGKGNKISLSLSGVDESISGLGLYLCSYYADHSDEPQTHDKWKLEGFHSSLGLLSIA